VWNQCTTCNRLIMSFEG